MNYLDEAKVRSLASKAICDPRVKSVHIYETDDNTWTLWINQAIIIDSPQSWQKWQEENPAANASLVIDVEAKWSVGKQKAFEDARRLAELLGVCVALTFNSVQVAVDATDTFEDYQRSYDRITRQGDDEDE